MNSIFRAFCWGKPIIYQFHLVLANMFYPKRRLFEAELVYVFGIKELKSLPVDYHPFLREDNIQLSQIYTATNKHSEADEVITSILIYKSSGEFPQTSYCL